MNFIKNSTIALLSAALVVGVMGVSSISSAQTAACSIFRPLHRGISGPDVLCVQQKLTILGYLAADSATGYFGTLTEAATKAFQAHEGIVSSGTPSTTGYGAIGPRTITALVSTGLTPMRTSTLIPTTTPTSTPTPTSAPVSSSNCVVGGITLAPDEARTFYLSDSVPVGQSCAAVAKTRTCNNGTLSGDSKFVYPSCSVAGDPNARLQVGLLQFAPTATNAGKPVISYLGNGQFSSPVTDTMDLVSGKRTVHLGFSSAAGGYINYVSLSGFGNPSVESTTTNGVVVPLNIDDGGVGKGWQTAAFSLQHNTHYNPTQAGSHDQVGAPVTITKSSDGKQVTVQQFNMPLFWENLFDFTEHEDVRRDEFPNDGGNTDVDLRDESNLTQSDEVRSELDYSGAYLDRSSLFGLPAFMHDFSYAYIREPNAIFQFTNPKARGEGNDGLVFRPRKKALDVSNEEPGTQSLNDYDLSPFLINWSLRVPKIFTTFMWKTDSGWQSVAYDPNQDSSTTACYTKTGNSDFSVSDGTPMTVQLATTAIRCPGFKNLRIVSTGNNPATDIAIGVYYPSDLQSNTTQTWIVDKNTMQPIAKEDRRAFSFLRSTFKGSNDLRPTGDVFDTNGTLNMGTQVVLSGMRSPTTLAQEGYPHAFELYFQRTYILFGTPNQIYDAVSKFQQDHLTDEQEPVSLAAASATTFSFGALWYRFFNGLGDLVYALLHALHIL